MAGLAARFASSPRVKSKSCCNHQPSLFCGCCQGFRWLSKQPVRVHNAPSYEGYHAAQTPNARIKVFIYSQEKRTLPYCWLWASFCQSTVAVAAHRVSSSFGLSSKFSSFVVYNHYPPGPDLFSNKPIDIEDTFHGRWLLLWLLSRTRTDRVKCGLSILLHLTDESCNSGSALRLGSGESMPISVRPVGFADS